MRPPMLTAAALTKRFGTAPALDGVDFHAAPGESVAVTGPSGSGKSTLLHCLAGIMRPDSGEVRLFDERIDTLSERRRSHLRRTRFAFLFQFGQLLPELPAEENVALPLMLDGTPRRAALEPARAELRRLGLAGMEQRRPGELSGGEAQRVALARALVVRPAVVFADEPTGALDRATGDQVMGVLLDTVAELEAALVVVTHDPRIASRCTRTIEIRDGRLSGVPRTGDGTGFDGFASGPAADRSAPAASGASDRSGWRAGGATASAPEAAGDPRDGASAFGTAGELHAGALRAAGAPDAASPRLDGSHEGAPVGGKSAPVSSPAGEARGASFASERTAGAPDGAALRPGAPHEGAPVGDTSAPASPPAGEPRDGALRTAGAPGAPHEGASVGGTSAPASPPAGETHGASFASGRVAGAPEPPVRRTGGPDDGRFGHEPVAEVWR